MGRSIGVGFENLTFIFNIFLSLFTGKAGVVIKIDSDWLGNLCILCHVGGKWRGGEGFM